MGPCTYRPDVERLAIAPPEEHSGPVHSEDVPRAQLDKWIRFPVRSVMA